MIDFNTKSNEFLELIENKLLETINQTKPISLKDPFEYLIRNGGKRIRPLLTMITCGLVGGKPINAMQYGVAIEILHNFTLVHDDIMDSSPIRRGKPTVHKKWDIPTGILVGDVMIGYACRLMPKGNDLKNVEKMQSLFMNSLVIVCEGQAFDMEYNFRKDITVDNYLDMIGAKTANLIRTSVLMGAYTGNANDNMIEILDDLAYSMGIAFQIQDDYLDLQGEQDFGKVKGQDIVEGKKTYMIIRTNQVADKNRELIDRFYDENGLPQELVKEMVDTIDSLGILKEAKEMYEKYYERAYDALDALPQNEYTDMMRWLLDKMKNRNS